MKTFFAIIGLLFSISIYSQSSFNIEQTKELEKSKASLYSSTKMFIADNWKSAKDVIQTEDPDGGIIQLKGTIDFKKSVGMGLACEYLYSYYIRFRVKDNKCRIEIYDVTCEDAKQTGSGVYKVPLIQPFDGEDAPNTKSMGKGLSKKKAIEMMNELRTNLNAVATAYVSYVDKNDDF